MDVGRFAPLGGVLPSFRGRFAPPRKGGVLPQGWGKTPLLEHFVFNYFSWHPFLYFIGCDYILFGTCSTRPYNNFLFQVMLFASLISKKPLKGAFCPPPYGRGPTLMFIAQRYK